MKNLHKLFLLVFLPFNLIQSAENNQSDHLGKRFAAGFGQGSIAVPATPLVLLGAVIVSSDLIPSVYKELDEWGKNKEKKESKPFSREDKAQLAGQVTGYLSTGLFILKTIKRLAK